MNFLTALRAFVLGILEGVTEWLPVSSTGHLIILEQAWKGDDLVFTPDFSAFFLVVVQLGAIMAVITVFFHKLNPVSAYKTDSQKKATWSLLGKIALATVPAVLFGLLFDDVLEKHLTEWYVVAAMLVLYGVVFLIVEKRNALKDPTVLRLPEIDWKTALFIGLFQVLSMVPGTSRSGVTIIAGMLLGLSRYIAAEFSFFLAIPVMLGAGVLRFVKYVFVKGMSFSGPQLFVLLIALSAAYLTSVVIVRFMIRFVKRHDFRPFGIYRICLGVLVTALFLFVF